VANLLPQHNFEPAWFKKQSSGNIWPTKHLTHAV
jgi:hypothetical protein